MAKKINKEEEELKKSISNEKAGNELKRSGQVKGPKGTGRKEAPTSPAKKKKNPEGSTKSMENRSSGRKRSGDHAIGSPGKTNTPELRGHPSAKSDPPDEEKNRETAQVPRSRAKPDAKTAKFSKKNISSSKEIGKAEQQNSPNKDSEQELKKRLKDKGDSETKPAAKKMARHEKIEGISAEEKMKLPNTPISDDLKEAGKAVAKNLSQKLTPERETEEFIKKKTKDILPEPKKIKDTLKEAGKNIVSDPDIVDRFVDKIIPVEENQKQKNDKPKPDKGDSAVTAQITLLSEYDIHLFKEGKHFHLYQKLGSHLMTHNGVEGVYFALWAPNAKKVSVIGDFNQWNRQNNPMNFREDSSGIWEVFIPGAKQGNIYKYFIRSAEGYEVEKGDPYAFMWETPPNTASVVWDLSNSWSDGVWLEKRRNETSMEKPLSVLEVHLGSWKRKPEENSRSLNYFELAQELPPYIKEMGFTHVEFMPVMEHPFFGSWGYQITGYFAPSSRFGTPQEFMHLIEVLHQEGIGVILDWVPSHFPGDLHGLHYFDGTFLYEHADPRKGFHPDWQSYIFNYGRNEVRSFLISNAIFWLDKFHADGLRVDAVASMLYLDYSRKEGEWEPNRHGGRENIEAIEFLKEFNEVVYSQFPDIVTIAEESTAWPMVSKPTTMGGLGFGMKWMMGWMHDTLEYFKKDPVYRRHHQNTITFSTNYAFSENFMLPLSHDEVVYGKGSLLEKMPGDQWNKFANLRSLYSYMYGHPGTKLLFMGAEFGQSSEWNHDSSLDWHLMEDPMHQRLQKCLQELNHLYKTEPALYQKGFSADGFRWIDFNDSENSVISFLRRGNDQKDDIIIVANFTPIPRENYRIGVPGKRAFKEIFNSDNGDFGGSNMKNQGTIETSEVPMHGYEDSMVLTLPPMSVIYLKSLD